MKFENTKVMNFEGAFRGMRNPLESWDKSDSYFGLIAIRDGDEMDYAIAEKWLDKYHKDEFEPFTEEWDEKLTYYIDSLLEEGVLALDDRTEIAEVAFIGPEDMKLAQKLIEAGSSHRKFMRQILVSVDITAPIYW